MYHYKIESGVSDLQSLTLDGVKDMVIDATRHMPYGILKAYNVKEPSIVYDDSLQRAFYGEARLLNRDWQCETITTFYVHFTKDIDGDYFIELSWGIDADEYHVARQLRMVK